MACKEQFILINSITYLDCPHVIIIHRINTITKRALAFLKLAFRKPLPYMYACVSDIHIVSSYDNTSEVADITSCDNNCISLLIQLCTWAGLL